MVNTPVGDLLSTAQRNHAGPRLPGPSTTGAAQARIGMASNPSSEQITTLQVKREDGAFVYIIKLRCAAPPP